MSMPSENKATLCSEIASHCRYLLRFTAGRWREADAAEEVVQKALPAALN